jgi:Acetyltransferase (GNAT) domain
LRIVSPAPQDVWEEQYASDPDALVTQSPGWVRSMCALGGWEDASRLYERPSGRLLVLPMVRRAALGRGRLALQSSYAEGWGMGGLLCPGGLTREDVGAVAQDLIVRPGIRTLIRPNPLQAAEWAAAEMPGARVLARLAHVLDLEGGFDLVWSKRFTGNARRDVRKAEKAGVVVERGSSDAYVDAFYELFDRSLERWAARQHEPVWLARWRGHRRDPVRKLRALARSLGDAFGVWVARLDERPVAAAIVLLGANAQYIRGAMDVELAGPARATYLVQFHAIREACEAGCRSYHLGETGSSSTLAFFKTRFGAEPYPYAEYRFERLPLTPVDRGLRSAVKRTVGMVDPE